MLITVDIGEWQSDDWNRHIDYITLWILSKSHSLADVWPDYHQPLCFTTLSDAVEFVLSCHPDNIIGCSYG